MLEVPFDLDWPDARPFRIRLEEHPGKMEGMNCSETHDPLIPGELGWTPMQIPGKANPQVLKLSPINLDQYLWRWSGDLSLPAKRGSEPRRIVVKEYERYRADPPQTWADRVVYADIVEV